MSYYQNDRNETTRFDAQRVRRAQEQQQKRPPQQRPPQRRPRRKRIGPAAILLYFGFILVFSAILAGTAWLLANDICSFNKKEAEVAIVVEEEDSIKSVAKKLKSEGLINYKGVFCLFAGVFDAEEKIGPGIYTLNSDMDYRALINGMVPRKTHSAETVRATIPEGSTVKEIIEILAEKGVNTEAALTAAAESGEFGYKFIDDTEKGNISRLEGYLFPDTYEFYKNSTPREAIEKMLDNFEYRFDEDMIAKLDAVNEKFRADYGIREIVIIASLIEKESAAPGESPMVSGVIYNRLFKWGNNPPYLNIDASIVYAQEGQNARIDTKLDSPYNTYLYEGLTPGPIANPGLSSLKAALNPENHNYYYYVLNPETGMHQFSTTYEEHQGYVRQFNAAPEIEIE